MCKFIAAAQSQPALLHFEIIADRRCSEGGFRQPLAFLRTAKALADFFAEVLGSQTVQAVARPSLSPRRLRATVGDEIVYA